MMTWASCGLRPCAGRHGAQCDPRPLAVIAVGVGTRRSPAGGMSGKSDLGTSRKASLTFKTHSTSTCLFLSLDIIVQRHELGGAAVISEAEKAKNASEKVISLRP